jgi:hypothetical protein
MVAQAVELVLLVQAEHFYMQQAAAVHEAVLAVYTAVVMAGQTITRE